MRVVERGTDGGDLPVHHARRRDDVGPGGGLSDRDAPIELERGVVVDAAFAIEDAAMPVVGVFVDTQIRAQHHGVAEVVAQVTQCDLHDAVGIPRPRPGRVFVSRNPEQDDGRNAQVDELRHFFAQRIAGVLNHTGERCDRLRFVDAFAHEERRDKVVGADAGLGHHAAQGRGAPQSPGSSLREAHGSMLLTRRGNE